MAYDGSVHVDVSVSDDKVAALEAKLAKLEGTASKTGSSIKKGLMVGAGAAVANKAIGTMGGMLGDVIKRSDQLKRFPAVMKQLGFGAKDSAAAFKTLDKGIEGLPTAMDEIQPMSQIMASITGSANKGAKAAVAMNDAFLSSGSSAADTSRGMEQFKQALSRGSIEMNDWKTMTETMQPALKKVAKGFGIADGSLDKLYDKLKSGDISMDELLNKFIELDQGANGFAKGARTASVGIETAMKVMRISVVKSMTDMLDAMGADKFIMRFSDGFKTGMKSLTTFLKSAIASIKGMFSSLGLGNQFNDLPETLGRIAPAAIAGVTALFTLSKAFKMVGGAVTGMRHPIITAAAILLTFFATTKTGQKMLSMLGEAFKNVAKNVGDFMNQSGPGKWIAIVGAIAGVAVAVGGLLVAYKKLKAFKMPKTPFDGKQNLNKAMTFTVKAIGVAAVIGSLALLAKSMDSIVNAGQQGAINMAVFGGVVAGLAGVFALFGKSLTTSAVGIGVFSIGVSAMALSMSQLGKYGMDGVVAMAAFGATIVVLAGVFALLGPALTASAIGIAVFSAGVSAMALSMAQIAQIGTQGAIAMAAFGVVVAGLAVVFALLGPLLTAGAVGILAFGAAVSMIALSMAAFVTALTGLMAVMPPVIDAIANLSSVIGTVLVNVIQAAATAITQVIMALATGLSVVLQSIGMMFVQMGMAINIALQGVVQVITAFADGVTQVIQQLGDSISQIVTSIGDTFTKLGEAIRTALDGVKGIIDAFSNSMKTFAQAMNELNGVDLLKIAAGITAIGGAFASGGFGGIVATLGGFVPKLQALAQAATQLNSANLNGVASGITSLKTALSSFGQADLGSVTQQLQTLGSEFMTFGAKIVPMQTALIAASASLMAFTTTLTMATVMFSAFGAVVMTMVAPLMMLPAMLSAAAASVTMFQTALTSTITIFTMFSAALMTMVPMFAAVTVAMVAFSASLLAFTAALTVSMAVMIAFSATVAIFSVSLVAMSAAMTVAAAGALILSVAFTALGTAMTTAATGIQTLVQALAQAGAGIQSFGATVSSVVSNVISAFNRMVDGIKNMISSAVQAISSGMRDMVTSIQNGISSMVSAVQNGASRFVSAIRDMIQNALSIVTGAVRSFFSAGASIGNAIADGFKSTVDRVVGMAQGAIGKAKSIMGSMFMADISGFDVPTSYSFSDIPTSPFMNLAAMPSPTSYNNPLDISGMTNSLLSGVNNVAKKSKPNTQNSSGNDMAMPDNRAVDINLSIGGNNWKAFVKDITKTQNIELKRG